MKWMSTVHQHLKGLVACPARQYSIGAIALIRGHIDCPLLTQLVSVWCISALTRGHPLLCGVKTNVS